MMLRDQRDPYQLYSHLTTLDQSDDNEKEEDLLAKPLALAAGDAADFVAVAAEDRRHALS